ncbi:AMP-binding protein [Phaeobacter marinintestinus]|uniref:AMP-binding protein n=1 Tax=Falsiphaeobacter marinintestinus TaxID=1492905 RepID=UPI0011B3EF12|nr:AMP-binding protein [Phaeobacter marinintestinus]
MTLTQHPTVYAAFEATAQTWPDRPMLCTLEETADIYGIPSMELTYGEALTRVNALSDRYQAAGYGPRMRIALLMENRPDFFLIWLAFNRLGASVVPINPDLRASELEYLIGHSEPALIIAIPARQAELRTAAKAAGIDLTVVGPEETPPAPRSDAGVGEAQDGPALEAAVLYTSGTTGKPKGCVLANTYFLMAGEWYAQMGGIGALNTDGERMITPLPIFHMNAMACSFMAMIAVGGCLIPLDRFHPSTWWASVRDSGATCLHYLGVMPSMLMTAPADPQDRTHSIRFGFGAGIDPKLQAAFETRFGFPVIEGWAMTETGAGAVVSAHTPDRLIGKACLGKPEPEVETRIIDDAGNDAQTDTPGELLVRRAGDDPRRGFFSHYYKNPDATAEAWEGGWFHTGDLVRADDQGRLYFVDRKKNMIRRSGENIAAVDVESVLMKHPRIKAAAVAPVPDALRGDEVFACLIVDDPSAKLAEQIARWGLEQMAYYKVPGYIAFVDELPLTATQKIQRASMKTLAKSLLEDGCAHDMTRFKKRQTA